MKNLFSLKCISIFSVFVFSFSASSNAGWKNSEQNLNTLQTQNIASDSLPKGVSKDWLEDLRDENGNRISLNENTRAPGQIPEDPEGDAFQRKVFNGLAANSQFGYSINSAGDVNGDGYDDVIIGAYGYNSFTGRAYIYYGGLNMNTTADVILTGTAVNNFFGYSVSKAGDVNGDGYDDVIAGAYGNTSNMGRTYIYFGGASMNNSADVILTGEAASNFFGISVSSSGDVNGDGYSDVIVGANGYSSNTGRSYIFLGGAVMNNTADIIMTGEAANNIFGTSVSTAGDVNADGFSDVFIGASGYSSNTGRAYIYLGGSSMDNSSDVIMTGEGVNNYYSTSVSSAGDINGDGYSDVIAGAYGINAFTGRAYIYFGGASMNSISDAVMSGEGNINYFGASVSSAGDINGDGFSDIFIGAYGNNSNTGKTYVYFGASSVDTSADVTMTGETTNSNFGNSVALGGDINNDGYSDLLVGAYGYSSNTGRAYFYDYFMRNLITPEITMTGETSDNLFGYSVSTAGDVNGDGYTDVIAGAYGYNAGTGRAYVYLGGPAMDNIADVTMTGDTVNNRFGFSVSTAGDVNGDGYSDIVVGAYRNYFSTGKAYIFLGGNSMDNSADVVMSGELASDLFGYSVSTAGDVNGDGYADVIIGSDYSTTGRAYIYYGASVPNNTADVIMTGSGSGFGISVSTAGDVNGDGYSDVIVGARLYNFGTGRSHIFFGGISMDNNSDIILTGESTNDNFGNSVASAGDVNSDGYSDVIIGAPFYGMNNFNNGRAYIYYGGNITDSIADVVITGEQYSRTGISVSSAEDANGDGYSDVIIGANEVNTYTGKAYIFFGSSSMNNTADIFMSGNSVNENFGISAASAGDINGDGYSDLIVGAGSINLAAGRAYIFKGSAISVKPILLHVQDVPNDQGGQLNLKWARSANDVQGNSLITDYLVQRSFPPSGGNFSWQNVANIPASHESFYTYVDASPSDSTANGSSTFFYRITARTNDINQSWRSAILSGRSLDNISPPVVSPFNGFTESVNVRLTWNRNSASDLLNYVLFRSVNNSIDPYSDTPLYTLADSTYLDTAPLSGLYYYFIVAQDIHNNYSPVATVQAPVTVKTLFTFGAIQGLYDAVSDIMIFDTVTVYLRNSTSPYARVDSSRKELYGPGTGQYFTFNNAQNSTPYYVEVRHRNALETWSAVPVTFVSDAASIAFSVDAFYAYGNNQIQIDSDPYNVFAFYSGDVNQDGTIDLTDGSLIDNDAINFASGYLPTDLNGDGIIDVADAVFADNNSFNFVSKITP